MNLPRNQQLTEAVCAITSKIDQLEGQLNDVSPDDYQIILRELTIAAIGVDKALNVLVFGQ